MYINTEIVSKNSLEELPIAAFMMLYYKYTGYGGTYNRKYVNTFAESGFVKITSPDDFEPLGLTDELFGESKPEALSVLAKQIRNLFPAGVKSGGYPVRSSESDITDKLRKFFKKHKYTHEQVLEATERYVERKRNEGWAYMQRVVYFIEKDGSSNLAAECDELNGVEDFSTINKML